MLTYDLTPASDHLSFLTDFGVAIGPVFFVVWVILMTGGASNGVNLVDGLDGLATGACIPVLAAYVIIGNWQLRNACTAAPLVQNCYDVRDPLDLAVVAGAVPLQHHFRMLGWNETTIVVRFWLVTGIFVAVGLAIFYVGWT